ncbi:MAG: DNA polymerase III subunit gamma/tau [Lachnospiraceae bacterium]|nr:DNA polymerase III subunit gamma/tau [Lachnospiraceae bacterium]
MSYQALYRKFRPKDFSEVKGQDHIVTTLKNQMEADRIGHAYLFCGTRGTGKTSVAKIFARAVNCENPKDGNPCGECKSCRAALDGNSMNVIEIDAASNNGVDSIREIREEVAYRPTEGKYKVYIIDEVHMLSTGAFNALLKTLEEPPEYVIFILATTEVHKIPVTILSRCQRYDFKRISVDTISDRLYELLGEENIEADDKAVKYIARQADGALRDALSLLDQCIAFYLGEKLTYEKVLSVLGTVDTEVFRQLFICALNMDVKGCMDIVAQMVTEGRELGQFVTDFSWYLRNAMLVKSDETAGENLDMSEEDINIMKEIAAYTDLDTIIRFIHIMSELSNDIKYSNQKRVLIEIALIKLCKPQMQSDNESLLQRIEQLEKRLENGVVVSNMKPDSVNVNPSSDGQTAEEKVLDKALPEDINAIALNWDRIINQYLKPYLKSVIKSAEPRVGGEKELVLAFKEGGIGEKVFREEENIECLREAIANATGKDVSIRVNAYTDSNPANGRDDIRRYAINKDIVIEDNDDEDF